MDRGSTRLARREPRLRFTTHKSKAPAYQRTKVNARLRETGILIGPELRPQTAVGRGIYCTVRDNEVLCATLPERAVTTTGANLYRYLTVGCVLPALSAKTFGATALS